MQLIFELLDQFATKLVQNTERNHGAATQVAGQSSQMEWRTAESTKFVCQNFIGDGMLVGDGQVIFADDAFGCRVVAATQRRVHFDWASDMSHNVQIDGPRTTRLAAECRSQAFVQLRIIVLKNRRADFNSRKIDLVSAEANPNGLVGFDFLELVTGCLAFCLLSLAGKFPRTQGRLFGWL
tara:strand:- start:63 stop:605 length:543 start_codon:yes stop_codon:yes gene_type:complete